MNRHEIATSILKSAAGGPVKKTKMMYGAYLSFYQVNDYLEMLQERGLLTRDDETEMYALTERGLSYIHGYDDLVKLLGTEDV